MIERILSIIVACILVVLTANVEIAAAIESTPSADATLKSTNVINIKDFGAHSITETGYETFDSSQAINSAIKYAATNNISSINFGNGKYYAKNVFLASNITYFSADGAELVASSDIQIWSSILNATNKTNITIKGLTFNGNKKVVFGDGMSGSYLVSFTNCDHITVENCYLYNTLYLAISLQKNCNYINILNNKIYDTDCGISSQHSACNNLLIDGNIIYGSPENQNSEPISIYNSNVNGLAHDISITNNIVHDKSNASGILVMNAKKVLIEKNTSYNCYYGINVGIDSSMIGKNVTTSSDITISQNNIYNCSAGIVGELNDSLICKNTIENISGLGIQLYIKNTTTPISNNTIIENTITNINSLGAREPAIRLSNTINSIIDNNTVSDMRNPILHLDSLEIVGPQSSDNIIQNNTNLGFTRSSYPIYIQNAKNTTIQNNVGNILDQGIGTIIINNKTN